MAWTEFLEWIRVLWANIIITLNNLEINGISFFVLLVSISFINLVIIRMVSRGG